LKFRTPYSLATITPIGYFISYIGVFFRYSFRGG